MEHVGCKPLKRKKTKVFLPVLFSPGKTRCVVFQVSDFDGRFDLGRFAGDEDKGAGAIGGMEKKKCCWYIWMLFPKIGEKKQIIHFNNKPSIFGGCPTIFGNTHLYLHLPWCLPSKTTIHVGKYVPYMDGIFLI